MYTVVIVRPTPVFVIFLPLAFSTSLKLKENLIFMLSYVPKNWIVTIAGHVGAVRHSLSVCTNYLYIIMLVTILNSLESLPNGRQTFE